MPILGRDSRAQRYIDKGGLLGMVRQFVPPGTREQLAPIGNLLNAGAKAVVQNPAAPFYYIGPAADMQDMKNYSGATMDELRAGNYGPALANLGMTGAALAMTALPGSVGAVDDAVEGVAKGADNLPMDTASRMKRAEEMGHTVDAYHGTNRIDRLLETGEMQPGRATSGPMPFFTDNPEVGSGYATKKADTSRLIEDDNGYENWFKFKNASGERAPITDLWKELPASERIRLRKAFSEIGTDWDTDEIVRSADLDNTAGAAKSHWEYVLRENKGNALAAAKDIWLDSGNLYGQEESFMKVLELAGVKGVEYDSPLISRPGVLPVKLRLEKPFETTQENVRELIPYLEDVAPSSQGLSRDHGVDMWDKNHMDAELFIERLKQDAEDGTTYAWTSIPDWVTEALKAKGYDSIKDVGGKNGGVVSNVYIPFEGSQVRSRFAKFDPAKKDSANLLAGVGGAGLLGLGLTQREDEY